MNFTFCAPWENSPDIFFEKLISIFWLLTDHLFSSSLFIYSYNNTNLNYFNSIAVCLSFVHTVAPAAWKIFSLIYSSLSDAKKDFLSEFWKTFSSAIADLHLLSIPPPLIIYLNNNYQQNSSHNCPEQKLSWQKYFRKNLSQKNPCILLNYTQNFCFSKFINLFLKGKPCSASTEKLASISSLFPTATPNSTSVHPFLPRWKTIPPPKGKIISPILPQSPLQRHLRQSSQARTQGIGRPRQVTQVQEVLTEEKELQSWAWGANKSVDWGQSGHTKTTEIGQIRRSHKNISNPQWFPRLCHQWRFQPKLNRRHFPQMIHLSIQPALNPLPLKLSPLFPHKIH